MPQSDSRRFRRLAEELEESGLPLNGELPVHSLLLHEIDNALRPAVHERRAPSSGTIVQPRTDPDQWTRRTQLEVSRTSVGSGRLEAWRRFVDGLSSWLLRRADDHGDEWVLFDRPAGSERDLVVLAEALEATIVQRHPTGFVRVVGAFGVLRWEGLAWHHEPPVSTWAQGLTDGTFTGDPDVVEAILRLAVHDLGSRGIGALLIYRPDNEPEPSVEVRLPPPPPLRIRTASHLAPLRHALAQIDGAAVFDAGGTLRSLGVRLVPRAQAEKKIEALGGTRHTSGLRYSHDDPSATVIVVSEDGPVSVLRDGAVLSRPGN